MLVQVLSNIFTGFSFYLPANLPKRAEFYRYIVAYPFLFLFIIISQVLQSL